MVAFKIVKQQVLIKTVRHVNISDAMWLACHGSIDMIVSYQLSLGDK